MLNSSRRRRHCHTETVRRQRINTAVGGIKDLLQLPGKVDQATAMEAAVSAIAVLLEHAESHGHQVQLQANYTLQVKPPAVQANGKRSRHQNDLPLHNFNTEEPTCKHPAQNMVASNPLGWSIKEPTMIAAEAAHQMTLARDSECKPSSLPSIASGQGYGVYLDSDVEWEQIRQTLEASSDVMLTFGAASTEHTTVAECFVSPASSC
eukprot:TRINITY_DN1235_c0_g1_i1.p1 TRINITY_DN1235_c0_g1~~TRINITY_DN1235_c0_g1_i1.p1  ORF type:complete len:207 (+),score=31.86 TRINITY_DN1235_c0_g1_i1:86-706(+)